MIQSTAELCTSLASLHNLSIASYIILTQPLTLIDSTSSLDVGKVVKLLKPIISSVNYVNLTIEDRNVYVIKNDYIFIFELT